MQDLFLDMGFNGGTPIDEEFFKKKIAGRQNAIICADLFPEWNTQKAEEWSAFKEAKFRERAAGKLQAMPGLERFMDWIDKNNLKKAAVTNAPRANAEFMLQVIKRRSHLFVRTHFKDLTFHCFRSWFTELIIGQRYPPRCHGDLPVGANMAVRGRVRASQAGPPALPHRHGAPRPAPRGDPRLRGLAFRRRRRRRFGCSPRVLFAGAAPRRAISRASQRCITVL